jgi:Zn finger protein HypA/HybF involved in hydrogenase expression
MRTQEFIEKSNLAHNFKYDYSKSNYLNNKTKVIIICREHGDFLQNPKSHYNGHGCPNCYGNKKITSDIFINLSNKIHNKKYLYEKVNYINNSTKVIITCKEHGDFSQNPKSHMRGFGCVKCSGLKKLTTDEFISKSKLIHGDLYSYEETIYISQKYKVKITCPYHGSFEQLPNNHLRGAGCLKCKVSNMKSNTEDFIQKSKKIHNDLYDYSEVNYEEHLSQVTVICKKHGKFKITPHGHINGRGCSRCKSSKMELYIENYLKLNNIQYKRQFLLPNLKRLKFDFAILDNNNLKCLIEYNGLQHYKFVKYFHKDEKSFNDSIIRDETKIKFCQDSNVKLHIIKFDEDIENKMKKIVYEIQHSN